MTHPGWSSSEMAARLAADLPDGSYVNLGIGLPTLVAAQIANDKEIILHTENGIVGMGPPPTPEQEDCDVVDAGKSAATLALGAAIVDQVESFTIIRGRHLDFAVLGGMQVSAGGDLANWTTSDRALGSVGGAMDLAVGARAILVLMYHTDKLGRPKILSQCSYPITAPHCVNTIYTNLAVISVTSGGLVVDSIHPGVSWAELQVLTGVPLVPSPSLGMTLGIRS